MLKLTASYSKKVPLPGQEFSSQQYHASVEVELPDGLTAQQLEQRTQQTFALVRGSVERELGPRPEPVPAAAPAQTAAPPSRSAGPKASSRQVSYLLDLAAGRGLAVEELTRRASEMFGVTELQALTRRQASQLIDAVAGQPARKAA